MTSSDTQRKNHKIRTLYITTNTNTNDTLEIQALTRFLKVLSDKECSDAYYTPRVIPAARLNDVKRHLSTETNHYNIIHFHTHMNESKGLEFHDDDPTEISYLSADVLKTQLAQNVKRQLQENRCHMLILGSCQSSSFVETLYETVPILITTKSKVTCGQIIDFQEMFYRNLVVNNKTITEAFDIAQSDDKDFQIWFRDGKNTGDSTFKDLCKIKSKSDVSRSPSTSLHSLPITPSPPQSPQSPSTSSFFPNPFSSTLLSRRHSLDRCFGDLQEKADLIQRNNTKVRDQFKTSESKNNDDESSNPIVSNDDLNHLFVQKFRCILNDISGALGDANKQFENLLTHKIIENRGSNQEPNGLILAAKSSYQCVAVIDPRYKWTRDFWKDSTNQATGLLKANQQLIKEGGQVSRIFLIPNDDEYGFNHKANQEALIDILESIKSQNCNNIKAEVCFCPIQVHCWKDEISNWTEDFAIIDRQYVIRWVTDNDQFIGTDIEFSRNSVRTYEDRLKKFKSNTLSKEGLNKFEADVRSL